MPKSEFVYVTYIKTTPDKLWNALTDPEVLKQWRFGTHAESDWSVGSSWKMITEAGQILDTGEIAESNPPNALDHKMAKRVETGVESGRLLTLHVRHRTREQQCYRIDCHACDR